MVSMQLINNRREEDSVRFPLEVNVETEKI